VKGKLPVILGAILVALTFPLGCEAPRTMNAITRITYTSDSGSILPELQWHEEFVITADRVTLIRNGRTADTQVNAGTWEIDVSADAVTALFSDLEETRPSRIRRVEPEDAPDGGGTERYTISYGRNRTLSLSYDPGVTYTGGEEIVDRVQAFLKELALPAEAAAQHTAP